MSDEQRDVKPVPELIWYPPDPTGKPREVRFQYRGNPSGKRYTLHCGDGTSIVRSGGQSYVHEFPQSGTYTAVARDVDTAQTILDRSPVVVRDEFTPSVTIETAGDPNNTRNYRFTFPTQGATYATLWRLTWPGATEVEERWIKPGEVRIWPLEEGSNTIRIEDAQAKLVDDVTVDVPYEYDPSWEQVNRAEADPSGMTIGFRFLNVASKPVVFTWGDGSTNTEVASPQTGQMVEHTFTKAGDFLVKAAYKDGTGTPLSDMVRAPWT